MSQQGASEGSYDLIEVILRLGDPTAVIARRDRVTDRLSMSRGGL